MTSLCLQPITTSNGTTNQNTELRQNEGRNMQHVISLIDLATEDIEGILDRSLELKSGFQLGERPPLLQGNVVAQLFEKPSLRTRNSFESAMIHLGGGGIFLTTDEVGLKGREALSDVARVLSSYADVIVMRTFSHDLIREFAGFAQCPVINGLSDELHPCQALTDMMTIKEVFGELNGQRLVYVGDGNNVARSLAVATALLQLPLTVCAPTDYQLTDDFLTELNSRVPTADVTQTDVPADAVKNADVVYTDVWASMGQEAESDARKKAFAGFQVNESLMAQAPSDCRFMHDMPARRGLEVTDGVLDGPQSIAFIQAENRMHLAKGLFVWLLQNR